MAQQIIFDGATESTPRVQVLGCRGDLVIEAWDERTFAVEDMDTAPEVRQEGDLLVVRPAPGNLRLRIPTLAVASVEDLRGALRVSGIGALTVQGAMGDARIEAIDGAVALRDLDGDLEVHDAGSLTLEDGPRRWSKGERERGVRDAQIHNVRSVTLANIGRDLTLTHAQSASIKNVGGSCTIKQVAGDLRIENIGGSSTIEEIGDSLYLGNIGGSATLCAIGTVAALRNVGGSLTMTAAPLHSFAPDKPIHMNVGGSTRIELPAEANVTIQAIVGGSLHVPDRDAHGPGMHRLVYGNGAAQLHIVAGGRIELLGATPQASGGWGAAISRAVGQAFGLPSRRERSATPAATGPTMRMDRPPAPSNRPVQNSEAECEAVLHMVAAGQVSPEAGDTMLEALENKR